MEKTIIEVKSNGVVSAKQGKNSRTPYEHQKKAMANLDKFRHNSLHHARKRLRIQIKMCLVLETSVQPWVSTQATVLPS